MTKVKKIFVTLFAVLTVACMACGLMTATYATPLAPTNVTASNVNTIMQNDGDYVFSADMQLEQAMVINIGNTAAGETNLDLNGKAYSTTFNQGFKRASTAQAVNFSLHDSAEGEVGSVTLTGTTTYLFADLTATDKVNIYAGNYNATQMANNDAATITVYGGTFSFDPTAYLASGLKAVANADAGTWTVESKTVNVHYDLNGGTNVEANKTTLDIWTKGTNNEFTVNADFDLSDPTKLGNIFLNWYLTNASGLYVGTDGVALADQTTYTTDGIVVESIDLSDGTPAAPLALYLTDIYVKADWSVVDYTVKYITTANEAKYDNAAYNNMGNIVVTPDTAVTDAAHTEFKVDGTTAITFATQVEQTMYTFIGWQIIPAKVVDGVVVADTARTASVISTSGLTNADADLAAELALAVDNGGEMTILVQPVFELKTNYITQNNYYTILLQGDGLYYLDEDVVDVISADPSNTVFLYQGNIVIDLCGNSITFSNYATMFKQADTATGENSLRIIDSKVDLHDNASIAGEDVHEEEKIGAVINKTTVVADDETIGVGTLLGMCKNDVAVTLEAGKYYFSASAMDEVSNFYAGIITDENVNGKVVTVDVTGGFYTETPKYTVDTDPVGYVNKDNCTVVDYAPAVDKGDTTPELMALTKEVTIKHYLIHYTIGKIVGATDVAEVNEYVAGSMATALTTTETAAYKLDDYFVAGTLTYTLKTADVKKDGCSFLGWYKMNNAGNFIDADGVVIDMATDGWQAKLVSVASFPYVVGTYADDYYVGGLFAANIYDANYILPAGAENSEDNPATVNVFMAEATLADATLDGYTFDGWYATRTGTGTTEDPYVYADKVTTLSGEDIFAMLVEGEFSLYAKFTAEEYTFEYDLKTADELTNAEDMLGTVTYVAGGTYTLVTPEATGFTFVGYYLTRDGEGTIDSPYVFDDKLTTLTVTAAQLLEWTDDNNVITLYIDWTAAKHTVAIEFYKDQMTTPYDKVLFDGVLDAEDGYVHYAQVEYNSAFSYNLITNNKLLNGYVPEVWIVTLDKMPDSDQVLKVYMREHSANLVYNEDGSITLLNDTTGTPILTVPAGTTTVASNDDLNQIADDLQDLSDALGNLSAQLGEIPEGYEDIVSYVNALVNAATQAANNAIGANSSAIQDNKDDIAANAVLIGQNKDAIDALKGKVQALENLNLDGKITALQSQVNGLPTTEKVGQLISTAIADFVTTADLNAVKNDVSANKAAIDSLDALVDTLQSDVDDIDSALTALKGQGWTNETIKGAYESAAANATSLNDYKLANDAAVAANASAIASLQSSLNTLKSEVAAAAAAADKAQTAADKANKAALIEGIVFGVVSVALAACVVVLFVKRKAA